MRSKGIPRRRPRRWAGTILGVAGLWLLGAAPAVLAQLADVKGGRDHPLVSRYEGSVLIGYEERKFDEFVLPLAELTRPERRPTVPEPRKAERLEGKVTRLLYVAPENRSSLDVLKNYEIALQKAGFQTLYACSRQQCGLGDGWLGEHYLYRRDRRMKQTPPPGTGKPPGQVSEYALSSPKDQRYLAAKLARPEGDVFVSLYVAVSGFQLHRETHNRAITLLEVIEARPLETGLVTVDAAAMAKDLAATGHVALYGIHFDTNSAEIRPESEPTLLEMAKLLKQDASLRLYVVGHTDNVGGYDANMALSQRRADAVVRALTAKHGIDARRLRGVGVGLVAPVASNDSEEGRAKNRRVELVRQ